MIHYFRYCYFIIIEKFINTHCIIIWRIINI